MGRVCNIATAHLGGNAVNVSKRACFTAAALMAVASAAFAHEPYLDDRSTATSVVRSYYNAINSREYSRAWSYRMRVVSDTDWPQDGVPYQPMYIERTAMRSAKGRLKEILPAECDPA